MIVTKDNERLYLPAWGYNAARIMTELAQIIVNNGGKVKPTNTAIISNRHLSESIREAADRVKSLEAAISERGTNETRAAALVNYKKQLSDMEAINNDPITVTHTTYITFVHDSTYYYYQVDDNPFFPFHYVKTPVKNNKYSKDAGATEDDKKEWLYDSFFGFNCLDADVKEAANFIYNMLINAAYSPIMRDGKKQRVPNTYNEGTHFETVYAPERIAKLDTWAVDA